MKKALLIALVLFIAVISTACINNIAVQELNNKAAEYMQKGDYESAMNRLQASLDLDSTMYETHYNLGIAATGAKKYETAIEAFENGLKIKPDYSNFYYSLAVAQSAFADDLTETQDDDDDKDTISLISKEETEANMQKAKDLKTSALENMNKYLEMSPDAEDKESAEELIKDCEKFLNPEENNETKLLEG